MHQFAWKVDCTLEVTFTMFLTLCKINYKQYYYLLLLIRQIYSLFLICYWTRHGGCILSTALLYLSANKNRVYIIFLAA